MTKIHKTAIVHASAELDASVEVGAYSIIGEKVQIGADSKIHEHVKIAKNTHLGKNNEIFSFNSIGEDPIDYTFHGEDSWLKIGDGNTIREYCSIHRGTSKEKLRTTQIGDHNLIMAYVHIAHDCLVGDHTMFVNNASLAGHVHVDDYATIGVFVGVHQFCHIGAYSFLAQSAMVSKDVPPFVMVFGRDAKVRGLNLVGLRRHGFEASKVKVLHRAYRIIFRHNLSIKEAVVELEPLVEEFDQVQLLIDALNNSSRGIVR